MGQTTGEGMDGATSNHHYATLRSLYQGVDGTVTRTGRVQRIQDKTTKGDARTVIAINEVVLYPHAVGCDHAGGRPDVLRHRIRVLRLALAAKHINHSVIIPLDDEPLHVRVGQVAAVNGLQEEGSSKGEMKGGEQQGGTDERSKREEMKGGEQQGGGDERRGAVRGGDERRGAGRGRRRCPLTFCRISLL